MNQSTILAAVLTLNGERELGDVWVTSGTMALDGSNTFANLTLTNGARVSGLNCTTTAVKSVVIEVTGTMTVASNSLINVDGMGYRACYGSGNKTGSAPPNTSGNGGGHGGQGGYYEAATRGTPFDNARRPGEPGGGGARSPGGGLIQIRTPRLELYGTLTANGSNAGDSNYGAGAGGGILLDVGTLTGNGTIRADGGSVRYWRGCGGGGRVAVI